MLTKNEKEDLFKDANSVKRRKDLGHAKRITHARSRSLDTYIQFLSDVQKVFPASVIRPRKTVTRVSKL
jgi:hypothetical protein